MAEIPGSGAGGGGGDVAVPRVHNHGNIVDLEIQRELQDSYLTYAMSTIMDRALPDVRDGLKPSQRPSRDPARTSPSGESETKAGAFPTSRWSPPL